MADSCALCLAQAGQLIAFDNALMASALGGWPRGARGAGGGGGGRGALGALEGALPALLSGWLSIGTSAAAAAGACEGPPDASWPSMGWLEPAASATAKPIAAAAD